MKLPKKTIEVATKPSWRSAAAAFDEQNAKTVAAIRAAGFDPATGEPKP